jgi:cell division protein FtsW (lipid II flippase)
VSEQKATADATPPKGPVIRKLEAAKETSHERLMRKHLPAWVISGAVNIGVVTAVLPFTGITLPFISSGGSSLVVSMIAVGWLLSISRHSGAAGQPRVKR